MRDRQRQDVLRTLKALANAWYDLPTIALIAKHPDAAVSARIRDLRHKKNGSHIIECRVFDKVYKYQYKGQDNGITE